FSLWGLRLPDTNDPQSQRVLVSAWIIPGGQNARLSKADLKGRFSTGSPMRGRDLKGALIQTGPSSHSIEKVAKLFLLGLDSAILGGPHHKVGLGREARSKEGKHIRSSIPNMDQQPCRSANVLDHLHP